MSQWLPNFFVLDQIRPCQACLTIAAASLYWSATELLLCLRCLATFLSIFWIQVCGPSSAVCSSVLFWQRNLEIASCCYILPYTASDHNWCMMMQINCCLRLATLLKQNLFHLCIESQTEREGITIRSQVGFRAICVYFPLCQGKWHQIFAWFLHFSSWIKPSGSHNCPFFQIRQCLERLVRVMVDILYKSQTANK